MVFRYLGGESTEGLTAVNPGRFQVLDVDERCDIKTFVQRNELTFKTGRGFYEFTKAEKISDKKEVVLVDKVNEYFRKRARYPILLSIILCGFVQDQILVVQKVANM